MFCGKCGKELYGRVEFCPNCGTKINSNESNNIENNNDNSNSYNYNNSDNHNHVSNRKKSSYLKNKLAISLIFLILAGVIVVVCVNYNSVNSSPEKLAIAVVESEYEIDIDKMVKCFPDFTIRAIAEKYGLSKDANLSKVVEAMKKAYQKEIPMQVEIIKTEIVDEYNSGEYILYRSLYDPMTDEEYQSITKIAKVKVELFLNGEETSITILSVEIDGDWYLLRKP